jgi:ribosome-binding factor A
MPRKKKSSTPTGQRPLRVGEEIRHALSHILTFEADRLDDPELYGKSVTVTEVRVSHDLRSATAFVVPLGASVEGYDAAPLIKALNRAAGYFRGMLAREVRLQFSPTIRFKLDESFDEASRIESLLRDPAVAGDLARDDDDAEDGDDDLENEDGEDADNKDPDNKDGD